MAKPGAWESDRGVFVALLTCTLQVGGIYRGQGIVRPPDVVDTMTIETNCLVTLSALALAAEKIHRATVEIVEVGVKDIGGDVIFLHKGLVGVTVSTDRDAVIAVR
jgi:hypothetical protein